MGQVAKDVNFPNVILTVATAGELQFGESHAGPTPLLGTDTSVRLMSGRDARVQGGRLLVKTEWDIAEEWMISRPGGDN